MPLSFITAIDANDQPILEEGETIEFKEQNILYYTGDCLEGEGTLYITNKKVIWMKSNLSNNIKGFAYDFYFISMHAVAREGFDKPCIYCHLDTEELSEIRFEPNDSSKLEDLYAAFCKGAESNPDPDDEGDVTDSIFFNMAALNELHLTDQFGDADDFDDDDEDDEEDGNGESNGANGQ